MKPIYFLTDDGVKVLKNLYDLSGYPDEFLENTKWTDKNDFLKETGLAQATFSKVVRLLSKKEPVVAISKKSLKDFAKPLFRAINGRGLQDQTCKEFESILLSDKLSLDKVLFDKFFITSTEQTVTLETTETAPEETRTTPEITKQEIAEWLELLDYRSQSEKFDRMIKSYQSKVIVFGIPAEDELIEKWILRRLREKVNHDPKKYNHEVEYVLLNGEQWSVEEFCAEIKKQLPLDQQRSLGFNRQALPNTTRIIDRLKFLSKTKTVLMRVGGLQEDWYQDFFDNFCVPLTATDHSTDSKIIIFLTQCSECDSLRQAYGFELLDPMDISMKEVDEWLGCIRGKINSRPNSIPQNINEWSSRWSVTDRKTRLREIFLTLCVSFGNAALRLEDLEPYLTKRG